MSWPLCSKVLGQREDVVSVFPHLSPQADVGGCCLSVSRLYSLQSAHMEAEGLNE